MADRDTTKTTYTPPQVTVMAEEELLKNFQVTSAAMAWWVAGIGGSG